MRICIIGCGRIAKSHIAGASQIAEKIQIVAAVGRDLGKTRDFCLEYGIENAFDSFEDAVASVDFEAVDICLPNHLHAEYTVKAAEAGKHILLEKPMANTVAECKIMNDAARKNNVTLMIGQSRRFFEPVMASIDRINKGEIGELVSVSANLYAYL